MDILKKMVDKGSNFLSNVSNVNFLVNIVEFIQYHVSNCHQHSLGLKTTLNIGSMLTLIHVCTKYDLKQTFGFPTKYLPLLPMPSILFFKLFPTFFKNFFSF